ncbi:MAG: DUF2157 domain-containing protein [Thermodesulfobacteriota bacterium]
MELPKRKARIVEQAIAIWEEETTLSSDEAARLRASLQVVPFDWKRLARYSFQIAIVCLLIAISSALADKVLQQLIERLFNAPALAKCFFLAVLSACFYLLGLQRRTRHPGKRYSNEALFLLGVLATAGAIAYLGVAIDSGSGHYSLLLLLAALIYGLLGLWFPSTLVWIFSLLSLGSWFGAETGYVSGWGAYYLGMNYPLRFVFFGAAVILSSILLARWPARAFLERPTRAMGLLYLFIALWIMSIFGNYGDIDTWESVTQITLLPWALLFGAAALGAIYHGLKCDDHQTRSFGLTFLCINLYTRFFEYFWDSLHKALFFALLAASFWWLGSHAEQIWQRASQLPLPKKDSNDPLAQR